MGASAKIGFFNFSQKFDMGLSVRENAQIFKQGGGNLKFNIEDLKI